MKIAQILVLLTLTSSLVYAQRFTCNSACGGNGFQFCSDFTDVNSSASNCRTCAPGYVGGTGIAKAKSGVAACNKGTCNAACVSCLNNTTSDKCYLCSPGYYDPVQDPLQATPCKKCHSTCRTCGAENDANGCYLCIDGYFDAANNPYSMGSCAKCDASCNACEGSATNCVGGCARGYKNVNGKCTLNNQSLVIVDPSNPTCGASSLAMLFAGVIGTLLLF
ncbi:MAG: hypothetical protein ACK5YA_00775 [bacterium]